MTEPLESRIAPAGVLHLIDVDGDSVVIKTTLGTNALLDAAVTRVPTGNLGGSRIDLIDLDSNPIFDGTGVSVTATRGAAGGDGLVNVASITALNFNLASVIVDGDLSNLDAGKGGGVSTIPTITVASTTGTALWDLKAGVGTFTVKTDVRGTEIDIAGKVSVLKVGGSLVGNGVIRGANIDVKGRIGAATIGRDIQGSDQVDSGFLGAAGIGTLKIGGSINGGSGTGSGRVIIKGDLGTATIGGNIQGEGTDTGVLELIDPGGNLTAKAGSITVGGNLLGVAATSARIKAFSQIGSLKIGGSFVGGSGNGAGAIEAAGIGSISIKGSIFGGNGSSTATIVSNGTLGSLFVGGDVRSFGGDNGTLVTSNESAIGNVTIKGSILGTASETPSLLGTSIGAVKIGGSLVAGAVGKQMIIASAKLTSLTVGGRVENAIVRVFSSTALIGPVNVTGDWIASSISAGIIPANAFFGDADDIAPQPNPIAAKIASITIGGAVRGTAAAGDHFGFVAERIGSFKVAGTVVPLQPGAGNDSSLADSKLALGLTGDVRIRELT